MRKDKKGRHIYRISMLFLILVMLSSYLTTGLYAKYATGATGSDSARVSKFDVSFESDTTQNPVIDLADSTKYEDSYAFKVTSSSKVAVSYDVAITVTTSTPLPAGLKIKIDDSTDIWTVTASDNTTHTFTNVGTFSPSNSEQTNNHALVITADNTVTIGNDTDFNVTLAVSASQVD